MIEDRGGLKVNYSIYAVIVAGASSELVAEC